MGVPDQMETNIFFNLRKFLVPEIVYGARSSELAGCHAKNFGASKAFLVTDEGVRNAGCAEKVERSLDDAGIKYTSFSDVSPNPRDYEVMAGAEQFLESNCDLIVAVGGGSPMDCAKGIGIVTTNGGDVCDYEGVDEVSSPVPPLVFIPTTAGSSADVSQFAIITDTKRKGKIAIISKMVVPDIALVDPLVTFSMPTDLTAATGMDALCHAFEAFVSTASSPLTDMAAISAVRLITDNLEGAFREPENLKFRENMMMASLMAGLAFSNASLGIVHAMAHSLGGTLDLPHGECNAILLEKAVLYNYQTAADKYDQLAVAMRKKIEPGEDIENAYVLAECISSLRTSLDINQKLSDLGVTLEDIPHLAQFALHDPCLATNPREANQSDIEDIFRQTYK
jgi:alcohol dehydrogenase